MLVTEVKAGEADAPAPVIEKDSAIHAAFSDVATIFRAGALLAAFEVLLAGIFDALTGNLGDAPTVSPTSRARQREARLSRAAALRNARGARGETAATKAVVN